MHDAVHHGPDLTVGLSDSTMMLIATECPRLRSLGIDLDFDGDWVSPEVCQEPSNTLMIRLAFRMDRVGCRLILVRWPL